ncbi:NlpC/P60 family protein [Corticibacterium sp. UT-5YL-CI-8]|nr:NlpC/P60 family protein [Tianweitania sp. UT-5YL-CI-8]
MSDSVTACAVIAEAERWIGTPYRHQGRVQGVGCDCIGLLLGVWQGLYGYAPETPQSYAADWADAERGDSLLDACRLHVAEKPVTDMAVGDLLLFRWRPHLPARHAGILTERSRFIHAYERAGVVSSPLVPSWRGRIAAVFSFPSLPAGD